MVLNKILPCNHTCVSSPALREADARSGTLIQLLDLASVLTSTVLKISSPVRHPVWSSNRALLHVRTLGMIMWFSQGFTGLTCFIHMGISYEKNRVRHPLAVSFMKKRFWGRCRYFRCKMFSAYFPFHNFPPFVSQWNLLVSNLVVHLMHMFFAGDEYSFVRIFIAVPRKWTANFCWIYDAFLALSLNSCHVTVFFL